MTKSRFNLTVATFLLLAATAARPACAQSVQPVIAEFHEKAAGSFTVTNSALVPMAVVLEPKSFSIDADGKGQFRELDPGIHLQISATSMRLEPQETATVFYKVTADTAPAWLTVYASFTAVKPEPGLNVRIMLPHTIYLYQKQPLDREAVHVTNAHYDAEMHRVLVDLANDSDRAGRAESVEITGDHASASGSGFPLLPHGTRTLSVDWPSEHAPKSIEIDFARFTMKVPVPQLELPSSIAIASLGSAR